MKKFNNTPNKFYEIDGKLIWESRSPALVAILIACFKDEEYVLIGKRGPGTPDNQGKWNVPCGYLDWDENGYDGICREVYEETGIYIPDLLEQDGNGIWIEENYMEQPFYVNTDPKGNRQNISLSYGLWFSCDYELPKLTNKNCEPDEVSDLKWLKVSQLESYDFAFNHDERIKYFLNKIDNECLNLPF